MMNGIMTLMRALLLIGAGLTAGVAGAFLLTRLLSGLLYGVSPTDPMVALRTD